MRILMKFLVSSVVCCSWASGSFGGGLCDFVPFDSADNGMGAEPGVVREFDSGITVPPSCLRGGRTWMPIVGVNLTRTAAGPSNIQLDLFIRSSDGGSGLPGTFHTDPNTLNVTGIPQFPSSHYYAGNVSAKTTKTSILFCGGIIST